MENNTQHEIEELEAKLRELKTHDQPTSSPMSGAQNNLMIPGAIVLAGIIIAVAVVSGGEKNTTTSIAQVPTVANNNVVAPTAPSNPTAPTAGKIKPVSADEHVLGDINTAKVVMITYSDFECPFCKRFHPIFKQVYDAYKGSVALVYRHFPLSFHVNAQKEAEATECAAELGGNDAFWKFTDAIYDRTTSNGTGFALTKLVPLAGELGLDKVKFKTCLDSGKYAEKVQQDMAEGVEAGVNGTPGNILMTKNGTSKLLPGALPFEVFKQEIDPLVQ